MGGSRSARIASQRPKVTYVCHTTGVTDSSQGFARATSAPTVAVTARAERIAVLLIPANDAAKFMKWKLCG